MPVLAGLPPADAPTGEGRRLIDTAGFCAAEVGTSTTRVGG